MVQQNDASASHPGHMDLALSCVTDIRDKFKAVKESDDQENRVNESAIADDDDVEVDHNETDGLGPLPERSSDKLPVYDMSLIPADNFHKFCYRHNPDVKCNKQTDANKMTQLQQDLEATPRADREQINQVWSIFGAANTHKRNLILQGILTQCCFPQLSFISQEVSSLIRIDFISTLPIELSLKILCYLDCTSLCNAAQVSKGWKKLADDDRVWHHMCEQHIDRKCPNCGWGLPLMHMKRAREIELSPPSNEVTLAGPYGGTPQPKRRRLSNQTVEKGMRKTRPWKVVYMERFKVERNWRKGTYKMREFDGHSDGVLTLKFDHKYMFTGSYDTTVKIWDVNTGKLLRSLESHTAAVKTLAFDEQKVITGSLDNTIKVWNYHTGQCLSTYRGHHDSVLSVDFYKKSIVSGSADNSIKVWNVELRTCYAMRGHTEAVNCVKIHPQSMTVFSASDDSTVRMWDLNDNSCLKVFRGHVGEVQKVIPLSLSKDYDLLVDADDEEKKTDVEGEGEETNDQEQQEEEQDDDVTGIDYSDPSRVYPNYILTASLDNTIKLWDVKTGKCVRTQFGHVEGIWDIAADTFRIVSGAHDRFVKIWDLQSGKCMHTFPGHSSPVTCVGLGDSNFASADEDGKVRMFSFDNFD